MKNYKIDEIMKKYITGLELNDEKIFWEEDDMGTY